MNTEIVQVSESFNNVLKNVRESDTPSKEVIISLTQAAYQAVVQYLAEDNMKMAIDTMEKTRAIENYLKARVHHQHAELYHANLVTATRFDMLREIGWWLDENTPRRNELGINLPNQSLTREDWAKPKFFIKDLGLIESQVYRWKAISRLPEVEYRAWLKPYLHDGVNGKDNELYFGRLLNYIMPKPPKEQEAEIVAELAPITKVYYRVLKTIKKATIKFFEDLAEKKVPTMDLLFLAGIILDIRKGLAAAEDTLRKLAEENATKTQD